MTNVLGGELDELRAAVAGSALVPGEAGYDDARRVWNGQIDRRPSLVVVCAGPADVSAALAHAHRAGLAVTVRGGGHNTSGSEVNDGGLMINFSRLNAVTVDPEARRARVGGGALLSDLDAATQAHGLATPGGMISHTGVAGLTLGGGMGWLTRRHGLSVDNLVGAEVVLADGRVVRADADEHPDLFWALRGGGGNFGAVTELEFALHELDPMVNLGFLFWEIERGAEALRCIRGVVPTLSREFNVLIAAMSAPPMPFVPEEHHGRPGVAVLFPGFGSPESHAEALRAFGVESAPLVEFASPIPYPALQQLVDEPNRWGQCAYEKGTQLAELTDETIDVLIERLSRRGSARSQVLLYRLDGAFSEVDEDATAYGGGRTPRYAAMLVGIAEDLAGWEAERAWVRDLWSALQPHSLGVGDYINSMVEFEQERIVASYGPDKYQRLAQIKARYDPGNVFRSNANIRPAQG
ncbi:MAG TPA: FAD-binding oxidoreductase [Pseudonocardiaceae bacterium]